jgi:hypothetical protein
MSSNIDTSKQFKLWRSQLAIHPACELLPPISQSDFDGLVESIKKHGQRDRAKVLATLKGKSNFAQSPAAAWDPKYYDFELLDGRSRLDAREAAGLGVEVFDQNGLLNAEIFEIVKLEKGDTPEAYVEDVNVHRRHLTAEQKQDALIRLIARAPEKTDRRIAKEVGVDHKTIGRARKKGVDVGRIPHVATRTDTNGRSQPATKPPGRKGQQGKTGSTKTGRKDSGRTTTTTTTTDMAVPKTRPYRPPRRRRLTGCSHRRGLLLRCRPRQSPSRLLPFRSSAPVISIRIARQPRPRPYLPPLSSSRWRSTPSPSLRSSWESSTPR